MCSVTMPASYDVLQMYSHSPPNYLTNPPYTTYLRYDPLPTVPRPKPLVRRHTTPVTLVTHATPRRPCLVTRTTSTTEDSSSSEEDVPSPTRTKKKVVFADQRGMSLTQIRFMQEPSNLPPVWSMQFLAHVTSGISAQLAPDPWEVTFPQPASDYLDFRRRLDVENVSLENVIVKESQEKIVGTVKVRNLSFDKTVLIRSSSDAWTTHEDAHCSYVNNNVSTSIVLYDTFSFRLTLPPRSRRIEFCVCFRCDGAEHWDNNHGANYVLVKKDTAVQGPRRPVSPDDERQFTYQASADKCRDAVHAKVGAWSEFDSWNHLVNDSPYW